jgi:tetratricopeptide (TPR) repeat protein
MFGQEPRLRPEPLNVHGVTIDQEYDYSYAPTPTTASASGLDQNSSYGRPAAQFNHGETGTEAALLMDLAHLEEVHEEAERMKLLGNKRSKFCWRVSALFPWPVSTLRFSNIPLLLLVPLVTIVANQEFAAAYNAYSQALQLSPVGPSSHVFLSNRAAALLSLKKYESAATDAKRAVALAPTFGKAHGRCHCVVFTGFLSHFELTKNSSLGPGALFFASIR